MLGRGLEKMRKKNPLHSRPRHDRNLAGHRRPLDALLQVKGRFMGHFSTAAIGLFYSYPQQVPAFISRGATHHTDARDLYQRRRELTNEFC